MKLTISEGNSKIGSVPNISLTPGVSCAPGVPCFSGGCYAMKSYRMYPNVRNTWDGNLQLWKEDPEEFSKQLDEYLFKLKPQRFRWHVGGDIPDQAYAYMVGFTALMHPDTNFLCFTKRYELDLPRGFDNLKIGLPTAWLAEDVGAPVDQFHIHCPGVCGLCDYKCWDLLENGMAVIFPRH